MEHFYLCALFIGSMTSVTWFGDTRSFWNKGPAKIAITDLVHEVMRWTTTCDGLRIAACFHHANAEREYAFNRQSGEFLELAVSRASITQEVLS